MRRARRILPALAVVLVAASIVAWSIQLPWELTRFGQSLVAAVIFCSNIYFYITTDYFSDAAEMTPLIHTWSLSLEEQFYLIYPLLLIVLCGFAPHVKRLLIWGLLGISFLTWIAMTGPADSFAFYALPTRGWQLLLGAIVALHLSNNEEPGEARARNGTLSLLGLVLLLSAISLQINDSPSRLDYLLPPTMAAGGTALVLLFNTKSTAAFKILSTSPLVYIGLISYSAYLWHQPIFVFARHVTLETPSALMMICSIVLVILLADISWRFVENPFRKASVVPSNRFILSVGAALAACLVFGLTVHARKGEVGRHPAEIAGVLRSLNPPLRCKGYIFDEKIESKACYLEGSGGAEEAEGIVIWGDSHAYSLAVGIQNSLEKMDMPSVTVLTKSGCQPVPGLAGLVNHDCVEFNERALRSISSGTASTVLLVARWALIFEKIEDGGGGNLILPTIGFLESESEGKNLQIREGVSGIVLSSLQQTIKILQSKGKKVVIMLPWPEIGRNVVRDALYHLRFTSEETLLMRPPVISREIVDARQLKSRQALVDIATSYDLSVLDPISTFCGQSTCQTGQQSDLWYWDDNHLSVSGVERLLHMAAFRRLFADSREDGPVFRGAESM